MSKFKLTVKHDNGTIRFHVWAQDEQAAKQAVMNAEGCPERAIVKVKKLN